MLRVSTSAEEKTVSIKMSSYYQNMGYQDAYRCLGMPKYAAAPGMLASAGKWALNKLPSWSGVKKFFIGNPRMFAHEVRSGKALAPGSLVRQGMAAPGYWSKGLLYGLPAVEAVNIARSDSGDRADRIGGLVGGTLGGLAAWGPGGILGSMAVGAVGERLGRGLVRTGKYVTGVTPKAEDVQQQTTQGY